MHRTVGRVPDLPVLKGGLFELPQPSHEATPRHPNLPNRPNPPSADTSRNRRRNLAKRPPFPFLLRPPSSPPRQRFPHDQIPHYDPQRLEIGRQLHRLGRRPHHPFRSLAPQSKTRRASPTLERPPRRHEPGRSPPPSPSRRESLHQRRMAHAGSPPRHHRSSLDRIRR